MIFLSGNIPQAVAYDPMHVRNIAYRPTSVAIARPDALRPNFKGGMCPSLPHSFGKFVLCHLSLCTSLTFVFVSLALWPLLSRHPTLACALPADFA